ncbi:MAG: hypothetical protein U0X74_08695 [Anaerolineales bacterium]
MNNKKTSISEIVFSLILLIATIATIILQIFFSSPTSTKTETTLFSVLQFIFSLAFSWILARISLRDEFNASQKKFAISAYRRIIEINNAVNRLVDRTTSHMKNSEDITNHELDVITEIGIGIRESIRSSISDWADIIGDEIETVEKIQAIREKQAYDQSSGKQLSGASEKAVEDSNIVIENLFSKLPTSLKITTDEAGRQFEKMNTAKMKLNLEKKKRGYIELNGEWYPSFENDIFNLKEGDFLQVKIGDNEKRIGVLIAYDNSGRSVGVILNNLFGIAEGYSDFVNMLVLYLGKSQFQIQILNIDRNSKKGKDTPHNFTAKIVDTPSKNA